MSLNKSCSNSLCAGFTLIELLVVISIVSILATLASLAFVSLVNRCSVNQEKCIGKNPQEELLNCERDVEGPDVDWYKGYRVERRFSNYCQTNWARTNAPKGSKMYVMDVDGKKYGVDFVIDSGNGNGINQFSLMGPRFAKSACIELVGDSKPFCVGPLPLYD